jgi:hypothetical protein
LESVKDYYAPPAPASGSVIVDERDAFMLFARNEALEKLLPAESARRFADLRSSLRAANARCCPRRIELRHASPDRPAARLTEATKYYERHVLAWYALGRVAQARSAREAIVRYQRALVAEPTHNGVTEREQ